MSGVISALEVRDLYRSYGRVQAVNGVSFGIPAGSFIGLIGPNGAGKSTLLECISGFQPVDTGAVLFFGEEVQSWPAYRRAKAGLVRTFQASRPFTRMSVLSNLMVGPKAQRGLEFWRVLVGGWQDQEATHLQRAREVMRQLSLSGVCDNYGAELSGGQSRLLELGRAMMASPKLLLLDEPFAGVSPMNRSRLAAEIARLRRDSSMTLLMVEHRLELIEELCDSVLVMAEGQIIAQGSIAEISQRKAVIDAYLGDYTSVERGGS